MFGIVSNHPLYHRVSRFHWVRGQAIPIRCLGTLRKALWIDGFRLGLETAILAPIHLGLLALTLYHAFEMLNPIIYCSSVSYLHPSFKDFINKIGNSDQESLSGAFRSGLKVTLSPQMIVFFIPAFWGIINGFIRATINVGNGNEGFLIGVKRMHLFKDNFWNNWMSGFVPLHPMSREFSGILKRFLWDGRLSNASREEAFQTFCSMIERSGFAKMMGFEALTQVLYSCHVDDLMLLQNHEAALYQDARQWFSMKSRAVEALTEQGRWKSWKQLLYFLYCRYLLWSVGLSMSWIDRIGWIVFKGGKLYSQVELMILIVENIISALSCPSPGTYTIAGPTAAAGRPSESCLNAYISNFGIIPGQNISVITDNMGRFYLDSCKYTLDLRGKKGLTPDQVGPLISSFVKNQPDVTLTSLLLSANLLDDAGFFDDTLSLLTGLEVLDLSYNKIGYGPNGSVALGRGLSHLQSLKVLNLTFNPIGMLNSQGPQAIALGLKTLTALTTLDLSYDFIEGVDAKGSAAIGSALSSLSALTYLDLGYNFFGLKNYTGIAALASSLSTGALNSVKYLNMQGNYIGLAASGGRLLGPALQNLSNLTYLDLSTNFYGMMDPVGEAAIGQAFGYMPKLTYLKLDYNYIGFSSSAGTKALGSSLRTLSSLTYLSAGTNSIGRTDSQGTLEIGRGMSALVSIKTIRLDDNMIGITDSLGELAMGQALVFLTSLRILRLDNNRIGNTDGSGVISIAKAIKMLPSLTEVDLDNNYIGKVDEMKCVSAIADAIRNNKRISTFTFLSQRMSTSVSAFVVLRDAIESTSVENRNYWAMQLQSAQDVVDYLTSFPRSLDTIYLSKQLVCPSDPMAARLYGDALMRQLAQFPNLKNLAIQYMPLEAKNSNLTQAIGDGLPWLASTLEKLDFSSSSIGSFDSVGVQHIAKGLSYLTKLTDLKMLTSNLGTKTAGVAFFNGISGLSNLVTLEISNTGIGSDPTALSEQAMGNALQYLGSLQTLNMGNVRLGMYGSTGVIAFAAGIQKLTALQNLVIFGNSIGAAGPDGEVAFGNALKFMTALTYLSIDDCGIGLNGDIGPAAIGASVKFLTNLTNLSMGTNHFGLRGPAGELALGSSLPNLQQLRSIDINNNDIGSTGPSGPAAIFNGLAALKHVTSLSIFRLANATLPAGNFGELICAYNAALLSSCEQGICFGDVGNISKNAFSSVPSYLPLFLQNVAQGYVSYAPGYNPEANVAMNVTCDNLVASSGSRGLSVPFWMQIAKKGMEIGNYLLDAVTETIIQHCRETVEECPSYFSPACLCYKILPTEDQRFIPKPPNYLLPTTTTTIRLIY